MFSLRVIYDYGVHYSTRNTEHSATVLRFNISFVRVISVGAYQSVVLLYSRVQEYEYHTSTVRDTVRNTEPPARFTATATESIVSPSPFRIIGVGMSPTVTFSSSR